LLWYNPFLAHFTYVLSTKHDGIYIPVTTSPIKKPSELPPQPRQTPVTLQCSGDATPIASASITTAKKREWLVVVFLRIHLLILGYVLPTLTQTRPFSPAHRDIERPPLPPLTAKQQKQKQGKFL
jgi:hypothetical protein